MIVDNFDLVLNGLTAFAAIAILISGLDDFFIDLYYYGHQIRRHVFTPRYTALTETELRSIPEQHIAIMIPAWREDAVIGRMLQNTLATVEYKNFDIFVGTYPNDEPTMLAVAGVTETDPRVHRIVCPHDGPTNKADCLNWIIAGIRHYDKVSGKHIDIFMLHDSEDLVHPLSFKLMNRFIPETAMVQLPVIPFEAAAAQMTAGTYLDEFAESHVKDMIVRERLSGMVPSAGVGTGFSREAIDRLSIKHNNQIFNVATFTEDYDLAFRLNAIGGRSILLQFFVKRTQVEIPLYFGEHEKLKVIYELVGTRGYFPSEFIAAVRQKARWTLGIVFHGWQQRGWEGSLALRYMVWRDRKTLLTNSVNILGYLLLLETLLIAPIVHANSIRFIPNNSWVWKIILIDSLLLVNRCFQRMMCITRVSSWKQAALSLPRIIWGNVINFLAVIQASYLFTRTSVTGKKPIWVKTVHTFPTEAQLVGYRRKLGDLLLESRRLTLANLSTALKVQKERGKLLGEVIIDLGYVSERDIVETLSAQLKIESVLLEYPQMRQEDLDLIPEFFCREHLMVVADARSRPVVIAAAVVTDVRMKDWLDANFPYPYKLVLAGSRNIISIIEKASERRLPESNLALGNLPNPVRKQEIH